VIDTIEVVYKVLVDEDGKKELVLGRTDRIVHAYSITYRVSRAEGEEAEEEAQDCSASSKTPGDQSPTRSTSSGSKPSSMKSPGSSQSAKKESSGYQLKEVTRWCVDGQVEISFLWGNFILTYLSLAL
jgi:hypothetical protein